MRWLCLILSAFFATVGQGELYSRTFTCTGKTEDDLCWLSDPWMYSVARWSFWGITPGEWKLILWGVGSDPCADCSVGRDIVVQVFWREAQDQPWNWTFVTLRNVEPQMGPAGYRVQGEIPLRLLGPHLFLVVRRVLHCEPFPGFSGESVYLLAPALPETPILPPSPPAPPSPPPPPACPIGPLFACQPGGLPPECIPVGLDLAAVARTELADTYGPGDAQALELGHYVGELPGDDYQDWYKFSVPKGEAQVVYFRTLGGLEADLYLVHDPCGTDLGVCLSVREEAVLFAPCQAGVECITIPNGLTECFLGERCGFFIRIVRRSGSGTYYISVLRAEIAP